MTTNPSSKQVILNLTVKTLALKDENKQPVSGYCLDEQHVGAIQAAYFSGRPLLVRGDPGLGKTVLAEAVASLLNWGLVKVVVHYNSGIDDFLYSIDHLQRLHDANQGLNSDVSQDMALSRYIRPGKIWQAIAPDTLKDYQMERPHTLQGTVLLIDEIDKADSTLPNALLEVLDTREITLPCLTNAIKPKIPHPVFIIITSNEERLLPQAFIRRCAVLDLQLKRNKEGIKQLKEIYVAHQTYNSSIKALSDELIEGLAQYVLEKREVRDEGEYKPGTAEFLDVICAISEFDEAITEKQLKDLKQHLIDKKQQRD